MGSLGLSMAGCLFSRKTETLESHDYDSNSSGTMTFKDDKGNEVKVDTEKGTYEATDENGKTTKVETQGGSEAELGLPFYPGSAETTWASSDVSAEARVVMSMRTTSDNPQKVLEFYKPKLKSPSQVVSSANNTENITLTGKLENGAEVAITATMPKGEKTSITVGVTTKKN